jgi:hypothetical protein
MATYDTLKAIVASGSGLTITRGISYDVLNELAEIASKSGSHLTITADLSSDVVVALAQKYGKNISFVTGLAALVKGQESRGISRSLPLLGS